jgi:hypothetical protein
MNTNRVDEETLPRRIVLQGGLALGCGLLVPTVLSGCDSRQGKSPGSDTQPASPGTSTDYSSAPAATGKVSQASVQYQNQPKGDQSCSGCLHFIPESSTCKLVEGQINPNGWCTLWVKTA